MLSGMEARICSYERKQGWQAVSVVCYCLGREYKYFFVCMQLINGRKLFFSFLLRGIEIEGKDIKTLFHIDLIWELLKNMH